MLIYLSMIDSEPDRSEFERIYRKYEEPIFRKLLYILHNQQDTEDVMQEVWIKVAKHMDIFRDMNDAIIFSYIMKMAINHANSFFRTAKKHEVHLTEEEIDEIISDDTLYTACERVGIDEIAACFAELPEIYRDVLGLYFFHEHSTPEIAKMLNMSLSTVGSRLNRGRKKLISLLERRGIHE